MKKNIVIAVAILLFAGLGLYSFTQGSNISNKGIEKSKVQEGLSDKENEVAQSDNSSDDYDEDIDMTAPDFKLEKLEGGEASLSDYRGKIVFLNFWASWCTFCDQEMPDLQEIYDENDDLVVLAVNSGESKDKVEKYINKGGYTFPVLLDEEVYASSMYLVSGLPVTYIIDKDGELLGQAPGMLEKEDMLEILQSVREMED